jgi:hypothetical protein
MSQRVYNKQCPLFRYAVDTNGSMFLAQQFDRTTLHGDGQWRISCESFPTQQEAIDWCEAKYNKLKDATKHIPRLKAIIAKGKK